MVNHHPSDLLIMQFSAGQLPNALGIMVACHIENCTVCRQRGLHYESVGGELLESVTPEPVDSGVLNRLLSELDHPVAETAHSGAPAYLPTGANPQIPRPLQRFLTEVPAQDAQWYESLPWSGFSQSIQEYLLPISDSQYTAKLYKIAAGKELPEHTHRGNEYTLVMSGAFADKSGDYRAGDFVLADQDTIHQPKAHQNKDCICFAVMDAPLKFTGFWGRMLNPFMR
ncbi:anti-sigma factor [Oleiphilus messinensis]|uniref:Anti-sigma factor n=1 Tax=Oleiphilus messinensis TaxID=141451 RepID=A0A1Y0I4U8_9GAMM|nr:ChrR family anti-sigma-E factor [Oleiphilus messinensis]ARU55508.1 anti-sigma factor [Oleiphilus messinensis]